MCVEDIYMYNCNTQMYVDYNLLLLYNSDD